MDQWALQKQILARYRSLGIAGHLPAFGGYAPWALAVAQNATHRIAQGKGAAADTAWIDGRDELYTAVANKWAEEIVADFGSDHVWQMDAVSNFRHRPLVLAGFQARLFRSPACCLPPLPAPTRTLTLR